MALDKKKTFPWGIILTGVIGAPGNLEDDFFLWGERISLFKSVNYSQKSEDVIFLTVLSVTLQSHLCPKSATTVQNPKSDTRGQNPKSDTGVQNVSLVTSVQNPKATTSGQNKKSVTSVQNRPLPSKNPKSATTVQNPKSATCVQNPKFKIGH